MMEIVTGIIKKVIAEFIVKKFWSNKKDDIYKQAKAAKELDICRELSKKTSEMVDACLMLFNLNHFEEGKWQDICIKRHYKAAAAHDAVYKIMEDPLLPEKARDLYDDLRKMCKEHIDDHWIYQRPYLKETRKQKLETEGNARNKRIGEKHKEVVPKFRKLLEPL